ncbi:helix-turn-helix transcriptional regulator [Brevundimonas sp. GCM10030266]|uniref:helix-turn-helix transcriptional regulator n=1 Tax=Brevundimonas sp. GCM10030266 TaxID=3273386 RepID=UPI00362071E9
MYRASGLSDRLNNAFEAIDAAGAGFESWPTALTLVRDLTGSKVSQLVGIGATSQASPYWTTVADAEEAQELVEAGVADLRVNSRRRACATMPVMTLLDENDFDTEGDSLSHPAYGDFLRRRDYSYICAIPLVRSPDLTVTLSVTRGASAGGLSAEGKRLFTALGQRVRLAMKMQEMLRSNALDRLISTLDQMTQTAFACGPDGKVLTCSPQGENLLVAGDRLMLTSGRLTARTRKAAIGLSEAIRRACAGGGADAAHPIIVHDPRGERPMVVETIPVPPAASDLWGGSVALVVARELDATRGAARLARLGAQVMDFTPAEEAVTRDLLAGLSPKETAERLGIAVGTVRVHVRNVYAKTGVRNQLSFAAFMGALR